MVVLASGLTEELVLKEVAWIQSLLEELAITELMFTFGFGANLPIDDLYQPQPLRTSDLVQFLKRSRDAGHCVVASDNLYFSDLQNQVAFRLDHEGDIACRTDDLRIIERLQQHWVAEKYAVRLYPEAFHADFI